MASSSSLTASHAAGTDRAGCPLVQAAIGLCLQSIDAHIAEKGVVDRAAGVGDVEVVDVDGERAVWPGTAPTNAVSSWPPPWMVFCAVIWMARMPLMRTDRMPLLVPCVTCNSMCTSRAPSAGDRDEINWS